MVYRSLLCALMIASAGAAVAAKPAELGYPKNSLGYAALMSAQYATAEQQLRATDGVAANDPARLINLGALLIRTGRQAEGAALLEQAVKGEDMELVLGDGRTMWSRDVARRVLAGVKTEYAGR